MTRGYHFGPRLEEGGKVRFRLWTSGKQPIALELDGGPVTRMDDIGGGWKQAVIACGPGTRYRFRLGDMAFPDPASRGQQGGIHGWSVVATPGAPASDWGGRPWEETVLYECHPGLMGGFAGIAAKLEELQEIGINAIELMPIAAFPGARNWGYDGVLPFAPAEAYGSPDDLRRLIKAAHDRRISIFLDVVYNHFGPDGNYLPLYAKEFFRTDLPTPWGDAIDFRIPEVQRFFAENARYWLFEFGFDGLRFDAVHAIADEGWLDRLAAELRREANGRLVHLVLENENNIASHLCHGFDAQWNDDIHHALHVLLTGETSGYYQDFAADPASLLARALAEGFIYQGQASQNRDGAPRGEPSGDLPPSAFVAFLQNHDQIGNRAFGDRLTTLAEPRALKAAVALLLLLPQIPMLFMGEESGSRAPFRYFTDHAPELAKAVREGRRREFKAFVTGREIPDPNAPESFEKSRPAADEDGADDWRKHYRDLLQIRRARIAPHIKGTVALGAEKIGGKAVSGRWRLGDGSLLTMASNLGGVAIAYRPPAASAIWGTATEELAPYATAAWIEL